MSDICLCFVNTAWGEDTPLTASTASPPPCTHWETNLVGVPSKDKKKLQAWLGKAKGCLLWGIIKVNDIVIVSALDASKRND